MNDPLAALNLVAFFAFLGLGVLAILRMTLRVINYYKHGNRPSIILRRDIALMTGLIMALGAPIILQFLGLGELFFEGGPYRLAYTVARDGIGLAGMAYWVWAEYFVIGAPGKEDD